MVKGTRSQSHAKSSVHATKRHREGGGGLAELLQARHGQLLRKWKWALVTLKDDDTGAS